ncbi:hypothetical protein WJX73_009271 [Symbiochloris irregularis]|uniref:Uncharacterized protein n=1 Tax=Symbiochloris irregularis TaxID=706552 RepID=A0AAW1NV00_9CHLO
MPWSVRDGILMGAGMTCVAGASLFYHRKQTVPFKVAYFLSWPVLGSAFILLGTPSDEQLVKRLEKSGVDPKEVEATREQQRQLFRQMRRTTDEPEQSQHVATKGAGIE